MKDNKGLIIGIIIVIVVVFIGGFFGTKIYNLNKYKISTVTNDEYQEHKERLKIANTITIENKKLNDDEYLIFNDIKIKNDFEKFEILDNSTDEHRMYVLKDNDVVKASFGVGSTTESVVEILSDDLSIYGWTEEHLSISKEERIRFFEKYNIKNDVDLIKFLSTYEYKENNLFTSTNKMKENYFVKFITSFLMSLGESITLIDGDYEGYILNMDEIKEVSIIKNNKKYVFTFLKTDYFTDEYIKELLNTLIIPEIQTQNKSVTKYIIEEVELKYETVTINDVNKKVGTKEIIQKGINGINEVTYEITYDENGNEVSKNAIAIKVIKEVVNEEVVVGVSN